MAQHIQDFINVLAELCEVQDLKVTVSESAKGGLITGAAATAGGLLLGPLGLLLGGVLGGVTAYMSSKDKFKPVAVVLKEMTPVQKKRLYDKIQNAIGNINPHEIVALTVLLLRNPNIEEIALKELGNFLSTEMNLRLLQ